MNEIRVTGLIKLLLATIVAAGVIASLNTGCSNSYTGQIAAANPKTVDRPSGTVAPAVKDLPITPTQPSARLTVVLDYFGIRSTHQITADSPNTIQLLAVVEDGDTVKQFSYPSNKADSIVKDYTLQDLRSQILYHSYSVGDYLKLSVLAFSCQNKDTALAVLEAFKSYDPHLGTVANFYDSLPQSKQLIGYYERACSASESWGASKNGYQETAGDLSIWFRIWSNNGFPIISRPQFGPEVKIQSVTLAVPKVSNEPYIQSDYNTVFKLVSNEPKDLTIDWQAKSSSSGIFDSGKVLLPKKGVVDVLRSYRYTTTGTSKLTYTISYNGVQLDSWSDNMKVTYFPDVTIQNVVLPSNVAVMSIHPNPYTTTFRLVNGEPQEIVVHWQMNSSIFLFDGGNVTVPGNGFRDITSSYQYRTSGKDYITYIISYNGNQIDTWTGTMDILPQPVY